MIAAEAKLKRMAETASPEEIAQYNLWQSKQKRKDFENDE
jgi:hypothetical protein